MSVTSPVFIVRSCSDYESTFMRKLSSTTVGTVGRLLYSFHTLNGIVCIKFSYTHVQNQ